MLRSSLHEAGKNHQTAHQLQLHLMFWGHQHSSRLLYL